jgi:hypothetical protein
VVLSSKAGFLPQFLEVPSEDLTAILPFPPLQLDRLREQKEFPGNRLGKAEPGKVTTAQVRAF